MMRRRSAAVTFEGQVLFVEEAHGHALVDCLVTRCGDDECRPVTLFVRFPFGKANRDVATNLLYDWVEGLVPVSLRFVDGRTGPAVELSTASACLVLEPEEATTLT